MQAGSGFPILVALLISMAGGGALRARSQPVFVNGAARTESRENVSATEARRLAQEAVAALADRLRDRSAHAYLVSDNLGSPEAVAAVLGLQLTNAPWAGLANNWGDYVPIDRDTLSSAEARSRGIVITAILGDVDVELQYEANLTKQEVSYDLPRDEWRRRWEAQGPAHAERGEALVRKFHFPGVAADGSTNVLLVTGTMHTPRQEYVFAGVRRSLPKGVLVVGGSGADFSTVYFQGRLMGDALLGVRLSGAFLAAGTGTKGGGARRITNALPISFQALREQLGGRQPTGLIYFGCAGWRAALPEQQKFLDQFLSGESGVYGQFCGGEFGWLQGAAEPVADTDLGLLVAFAGAGGTSAANRWDWTRKPPEVSWRAEIGAGFSGVAVRNGMVFTLGNTNHEDRVTALDAATGTLRWQYRYPCRALGIAKPDEPGPRSTPLAHAGAVYTLSRDGRVLCLDALTGALRWWRDIPAELGEKPPYWGFSTTALVWQDLLIWAVGDQGLALRAASGEVVWKSTPRPSTVWKNQPVGTSGYATPAVVEFDGKRRVTFGNETQWVVVEPEDGSLVWSTPWEVPYGVNSAQPVIYGDAVVLSGGYGYGMRRVPLGGGSAPVWENKSLRSHFSAVANVGDYLYGIDGNQQDGGRCSLVCLRAADGTKVWAKEQFGFGNLTIFEGRLLIASARGELVAVDPDASGYRERGRVQVVGGETWTAPVCDPGAGAVYVRNRQGTLVRVDLP